MKEIKLPSGNILMIGNIPFELSNNLKKAVLKEIKSLSVNSSRQVIELCKDYLCTSFSSDEVEKCLWECFKKCSYGISNLKIDKDTFEPIEARQDFTDIQIAVAEECLMPFIPGLYALLQRLLVQVASIPT